MGEAGAVMWNFEQKGVARVLSGAIAKDELELMAIDAGADDIQEDEDGLTILTAVKNLHNLKKTLEDRGVKVERADIEYVAKTSASLSEDDSRKLEMLIEQLDDCEDVNDYYTNVE